MDKTVKRQRRSSLTCLEQYCACFCVGSTLTTQCHEKSLSKNPLCLKISGKSLPFFFVLCKMHLFIQEGDIYSMHVHRSIAIFFDTWSKDCSQHMYLKLLRFRMHKGGGVRGEIRGGPKVTQILSQHRPFTLPYESSKPDEVCDISIHS